MRTRLVWLLPWLLWLVAPVLSAQKRDPCVDFYAYVCSDWQARNPVPPDRVAWGRFNELQQRGEGLVREILDQAAVERPGRSATEQQLGDYYASCLDDAAIETAGIGPLAGDLASIAAVSSRAALPAAIARLHRQGVPALFAFGSDADHHHASQVIAVLDQGGLGLPDRGYYLNDDARSIELRRQYVEHVGKMLALAGDAHDRAAAQAKAVMAIESALASHALDQLSRRDPQRVYHRLGRSELAKLAPAFDWSAYFTGVGAPAFEALNVVEPAFVSGLNQLLESTSLDDWKAYLRWHLLHASAAMLPRAFVAEDFAFFTGTMRGAKELAPRWRRCVNLAVDDLGEAIGRQHVLRTFDEQSKARTLAMVAALERALAADIKSLPWMSEQTKAAALVKLRAITNRIGYPDIWRDYSGLAIVRGDALGNRRRARAWGLHRLVARIGRPLDKHEWPYPPMTINADYDARANAITFPAGILQPPVFDSQADDAANFGGMGAVIGHELTHGFDDQGRQFDAEGNLRDWWTAEDTRQFQARAGCLDEQYGRYVVIDTLTLNGKLTLGENIADNGGLRIAYMAMLEKLAGQESRSSDGNSPHQRFFLAWANIWCENRTDAISRKATAVDPHAPGRYRVNGTVSNMPEFRDAFGCKAEAPMVNQNVCRVW